MAIALFGLHCDSSAPEPTKDTGQKPRSSASSRTVAPKPSAPAAAPKTPVDPALLAPEKATLTAPDKFKARFTTTEGDFVIEVTRDWAPNGADRFFNLVKLGYFTDVALFRVVKKPESPKDFMVQFGIHGVPEVATKWLNANIQDDPVKQSNTEGFVTYAQTNSPNSRSVQIFINYTDNSFLDSKRFAPFGKVVEGMDVVRKFYSGYGEKTTSRQGDIASKGNDYLHGTYPELDYIKSAVVVGDSEAPAGSASASASAAPSASASAATSAAASAPATATASAAPKK
ncbi:MAG: peptidylprolyl isomerase [Polyangiaceae bacterium]|nr:peptidylprolyl isomerase [Polyangiaceae bacterium]